MIGDDDLRDCFAMFGMMGLVMAYKDNHPETTLAERAYIIADAMLEARNKIEPEVGIVAAKTRRRK
jgi:hypothetical protein